MKKKRTENYDGTEIDFQELEIEIYGEKIKCDRATGVRHPKPKIDIPNGF